MKLRTWPAALAATCTVLAPGGVARADAAGPTDYVTAIVAIEPADVATAALAITIEGGDAFVRLVVRPGHEVVVLGYGGEPYLRFGVDGAVDENRASPAAYYNSARFGGAVPAEITADLAAAPRWRRVADDGSWAWHDHRAHWMSPEPLIGLAPGDSLPVERIDLVVDGVGVVVHVETTLQPPPSRWPTATGLTVGLGIAALAVWRARRRQWATAAAATIAGVAATAVGAAQYRSLPSDTGPRLIWWALPAIATAAAVLAAATLAATRKARPLSARATLAVGALVALAGLQLTVWVAARHRVWTRAVLSTELPFWVDRAGTAAVAGAAVGLVGTGLAIVFAPPAAPS